jgi:hypothetical protein
LTNRTKADVHISFVFCKEDFPAYSIVQVANGDEKVADWKAWFAEQIKRDEEIQ